MIKSRSYESELLGQSCIEAEHSSGLKIYIIEKPQFRTAHAVFGTKYGSIDNCFSVDGENISVPEGIAHFLEHKLFESEDGDAFSRFSKTGAYANAYTSFDRTCYLFSCSDKFEENLNILLDFVQHPFFTAKTVKKEQGIIGQEIRMYDDSPSWRLLFNLLTAMYHNHPVRIDIAGTTDSIAQITDKLLYSCYNAFYNPSNMFLCIAGNVDAAKTLEIIDRSIVTQEAKRVIRGAINEPESIRQSVVRQSFEVAMPLFCIGYKERCGDEERSEKEVLCSEILLELIAGEISPLYEQLTKRGLINDAFDTEYFNGRGFATPLFSGESNDPEEVLNCIKAEVARLKKEGIDRKLFSAVERAIYGSAIRQFNSVESTVSELVGAAMTSGRAFDSVNILKNITIKDVEDRLNLLEDDKIVLSVIDPKKKG